MFLCHALMREAFSSHFTDTGKKTEIQGSRAMCSWAHWLSWDLDELFLATDYVLRVHFLWLSFLADSIVYYLQSF